MSYVLTVNDYAKALKVWLDLEIKYEAFGINLTLSIGGIICEYHDVNMNYFSNESTVKTNLHSYFSEKSSYNVATTF